MRIRLMGTREETTAAVTALHAVFEVLDVSEFYPNRGASLLGRVYLDVAEVQRPVTRAGADRINPHHAIEQPRGTELPQQDPR